MGWSIKNSGVSSLFCNEGAVEEQPETAYIIDGSGGESIPEQGKYVENVPKVIDEKKKVCKSVTTKLTTPEDVEKFESIKKALWTKVDSDVFKWCLGVAYRSNKKKIERILAERGRIEEEKERIGTL